MKGNQSKHKIRRLHKIDNQLQAVYVCLEAGRFRKRRFSSRKPPSFFSNTSSSIITFNVCFYWPQTVSSRQLTLDAFTTIHNSAGGNLSINDLLAGVKCHLPVIQIILCDNTMQTKKKKDKKHY